MFPRILLWNAQSLVPKRNELLLAIADLQVEILLITETWLDPNYSFSIPGYTIIRSDRSRRGGGVAILVHNSFAFTIINGVAGPSCEACFIKIYSPNIVIGVVYSPPNSGLSTNDLNIMARIGSPFLIGGDWNAVHTSWNNFRSNKAGRILFNHMISSTYRVVHPDSFTHKMPNRRPTTIDFFLTNCQHDLRCEVNDRFNSDHLPVLLSVASTENCKGLDRIID